MAPEIKVYEVLVSFEDKGLSYEAGKKYELAVDLVSTLKEGIVKEFVDSTTPAPIQPKTEGNDAPKGTVPAKEWAGNHTIPA